MRELSRRAAFATLAGAGLWASGALAQSKDLQVEQVPGHPHRPPHHHPLNPAPALDTGPVQVSLMPIGPSSLSVGEPIRFKMVALAEGFGHLYVLSASGRTQLWMENVRVHAGVPVGFPRGGQIVRATPPAGDETVLFVATRSRIGGFLGGGSVSTVPFDLQYTHDTFRGALQAQLDALPRNDWAIAELHIRVND